MRRIALAGTNGTKFPAIRAHMARAIGEAYPGSRFDLSVDTFPSDDAVDPAAYKAALAALPRGSAVTIFTPDDTHYEIAMDCVAAGMHVLVTKPIVMTLAQHRALAAAAAAAGVLVAVEVHKRWDPIYVDARDRLRRLGPLNYMYAYMSQPKYQLETFRAWAGVSSDISYYLNSHHVDFSEWVFGETAKPTTVSALASKGVAEALLGRPCEDSITVNAVWEARDGSGAVGTATYTASWAAPKADVHSQQRFFAMCAGGEVTVDQAHRGASVATDAGGYASINPLFMKYTPDARGAFAGQGGYGYRSIEAFVAAAAAIQAGEATPGDFEDSLATVHGTMLTTAILEAGRRSLDAGGAQQVIVYDEASGEPCDIKLAGSYS